MQSSVSALRNWWQERSDSTIVYPENFLRFERGVFLAVCIAQVLSPRLPWTPVTIGATLAVIACLALLIRPPLSARNGDKLLYLLGATAVTFLAVFVFRPIVVLPLYLGIVLKSRFLLGAAGTRQAGALVLAAYLGNVAVGEAFGWLDMTRSLTATSAAVNGTIILVIGMWGASTIADALAAERTSRLKAEALAAELAVANERLVAGARQAEELATAQERNRIAREIHDSLGHCLTALNVQLEASLKLADRNPERAATALTQAKQLGSEALTEVRRSVRALRPQMLEGQSLGAAIERLAQDFERNTGIDVHTEIEVSPQLESPHTDALFRIVQEGLTNIARYSQAGNVQLKLKPEAGGWKLRLQDDGVGFDPTQQRGGFGLWSIRERVQTLSGTLDVHSAPGAGCALEVWLPEKGHVH